jgi:hypothetical protein
MKLWIWSEMIIRNGRSSGFCVEDIWNWRSGTQCRNVFNSSRDNWRGAKSITKVIKRMARAKLSMPSLGYCCQMTRKPMYQLKLSYWMHLRNNCAAPAIECNADFLYFTITDWALHYRSSAMRNGVSVLYNGRRRQIWMKCSKFVVSAKVWPPVQT